MSSGSPESKPSFVDLFAGCGGLSLGLLKAGWSGVLAIEKDPLAFKTIEHNLIGPETCPKYDWPPWFPKEPHTVADFNARYAQQMQALRGRISLVIGGAPCQGFSLAGRREREDERNSLFQDFLDTVATLSPTLVMLENVHAITMPFVRSGGTCGNRVSVADEIKTSLEAAGYKVFSELVKCQEFGVPQRRSRYFIAGVKNGLIKHGFDSMSPFSIMPELRQSFLSSKGLRWSSAITITEAVSDLEIRWGTVKSEESPRFQWGVYGRLAGDYQRLLRIDRKGNQLKEDDLPDSHRFANHASSTIDRFRKILECTRGVFSVNYFCRFRRLFLPVHPLFPTALLGHSGAVAGDVEFQDDRVVDHPVDGRGHWVGEDVLPLGEDQVGRDAQGPAFVAFGDEREEHLGLLGPLGQVPQVVQQQEVVVVECQGRRQNIPVGRSKNVPPERSLASVNVRASCSGEVSQRQAGSRLGG